VVGGEGGLGAVESCVWRSEVGWACQVRPAATGSNWQLL
jgi:hypothetical protein